MGWQAGLYGLVLLALVTSVISIYYYIRVIKMMVVKEPQEMSAAVLHYPVVQWNLPGNAPLAGEFNFYGFDYFPGWHSLQSFAFFGECFSF